MIMGYLFNGLVYEVLLFFDIMIRLRIKLNFVIFFGILFVCSYVELINEGWVIYRIMSEIYEI